MNSFEQSLAEADVLRRFRTEAAAAGSVEELGKVLERAYEADNLYVFGEFLDDPRVKQNAGIAEKLSLFAYGCYNDAAEAVKKGAAPLTPKQEAKLRELTLASLVRDTHLKTVPYEIIKKQLDISEVRKLEDVIIDAIYHNVISGKLDEVHESFIIDKFIARDVRPERVGQIASDIAAWQKKCVQLIQYADSVTKDNAASPAATTAATSAPPAAAAAAADSTEMA